ncbi:hypothetical protein EU527_05160 [Candidatus Thorarchaeota archaeon]|nr:MAG: hypothetical protein EU527_05160 [Candidatus Thorarchaeota archaeon]
MLHLESFWYRPDEVNIEPVSFGETLLIWIHSEQADEQNRSGVFRKMVKNIRWLAQKVGCMNIALHSFAHLDDSKSKPEFADVLIADVASKLENQGFNIHIVPFGQFNEFSMHVKGPSLAKVFKRF